MNWRHRLGIAFLVLGSLIGGATWGTAVNHAVNPVPIASLGLTEEAAKEMRDFVSGLPRVDIVGADSDADNRAKRVMLSGALLAANGGEWPWNGPQEIGDCPSHSVGHAVEVDIGGQILVGANIEFRPTKREWFYYGSRVRNGRVQLSGEGGIPGWAGEFGRDVGVLFQQTGVNPYSGREAADWGRKGPPKELYDLAAPYKIGMLAPVRSAQEACNFLAAGYPIAFGSMKWGTNSIKLVEGRNVARDTTNWPHAQCCVGYDGTTKAFGTKGLFRIDNSWGPEAHNPKSTFPDDMPGGYYATWADFDSICLENMAVAISGTQGFEKRDLNFDVFKAVGATAPPTGDPTMFAQLEIEPMYGYGVLAVCYIIGLLLLLIRGNVFRQIIRPAGALAILISAGAIQAQELNFQAIGGVKSTSTVSAVSSDLNFSAIGGVESVVPVGLNFGKICCTCGPSCDCTNCDCGCSAKTVSASSNCKPGCACAKPNCNCGEIIAAGDCETVADAPKAPRVQWLMAKMESCPPCAAAEKDFKPWAEKSGWICSDDPSAHIRITSNPRVIGKFIKPDTIVFPSFFLLVDGRIARPFAYYPGREYLVNEYLRMSSEFPANTSKVQRVVKGVPVP